MNVPYMTNNLYQGSINIYLLYRLFCLLVANNCWHISFKFRLW